MSEIGLTESMERNGNVQKMLVIIQYETKLPEKSRHRWG
jgi:hypothetical protein